MSNPFNFDPFAAPAPAPSASGAGAGAGGSGTAPAPDAAPTPIVAANPFDNFGFASNNNSSNQQANNSNNSNVSKNNNGGDWQKNARAMMSTGNGVWKNASAKVLQPLAASSEHSSSSSLAAKNNTKQAKRIVPYTSPISTLESNWDPWLFAAQSSSPQSLWKNGGNFTTYLVVRANDGCCLSGGVESLLRWSKQKGSGGAGMGVETDLGTFESMSMSSEGGTEESSFYNSSDAGNPNRPLGKAPSVGMGGSMRFLKSGLKKAQQSIERSVTTMAIKADGGKNPDQLCVSLHYLGGMNGGNNGAVNMGMANAVGAHGVVSEVGDVCLSRTGWAELPSSPCEEEGVLFSIPLCVPDLGFLEAASAGGGNGVQLTIRLYIRSGATLLKAVANREYCIGESALLYSNLMQLIQPQQQSANNVNNNGGVKCGTINVPFTTGMLAETSSFSQHSGSLSSQSSSGGDAPAAVIITATPRIKFNPPCTYGWSLTDPVTTPPGGQLNWLNMFQLPLDQGYVFNFVRQHRLLNSTQQQVVPTSTLLLANERAVESALALPLATTCSRLFSVAASQSQKLAANAAIKTRRKQAAFHHMAQEDEFRSKAAAALLDGSAVVELGVIALVLLGESTPIDCGFGGVGCGGLGETVPSVKAYMTYQPPHCIFEESLGGGSCPLLDEDTGSIYLNGGINAGGAFAAAGGVKEAIVTKFCPRILSGSDDLLPGVAGSKNGKHVGSVRLEVAVGYTNNNSGPVDNISLGMNTNQGTNTNVEGVVDLEQYLDDPRMMQHHQQGVGKVPVLAPAIDANTGSRIGTFVLLLRVTSGDNNGGRTPTSPTNNTNSASSGLVSVVGLDTLTEELGLVPYLDGNAPPPNSQLVACIRRRQIATMGSFMTPRFLDHQANVVRERDVKEMENRYETYYRSVLSGVSAEAPSATALEDESSDVPLYKRRTPKPFRPSNSRGVALLAGIGFNVHVQSLSLNMLNDGQPSMQAAVTQSVTHGAPADHAKGFGGPSEKDDSAPRGGLRRLESKRLEFAKELEDSVTGLISAVGEHFKSRASSLRQQAGIKPSRHVPPNLPAITHYRNKTVECAQILHGLTWDISVRRANCFSQALGIAVTSYMASVSDGGPAWRGGYASTWVRHGYLVTFEGLLSAVGKELGMIEDASVAISMLRMVSVVLVPDDVNSSSPTDSNSAGQRIPVPHSPYVRWVHLIYLTSNGSHSKTQYRLEIGLDPSYYQSRVPEPLKNGVGVQFFPILFQMGVDIRQWGVNAGRNVTNQIKDKPKSGGGTADIGDADNVVKTGENELSGSSGSILDDGDEDDDGDVADNEILLVLNVEGYRKLNAYAHSVNPTTAGATAASAPAPVFDSLEQAQAQPLPVHPSLVSLSEAIKASAGKMEHSVLDRAGTACQRFGGGSTVFCKSGKDRTAMQVTFKQAQFVQRFMDKKEGGDGTPFLLEDTPISYDSVFSKSTLMRKHGNRIPICEKNAGEPKFAFNPLQRKFMPEMLRPEASLCTWSKPES